MNVAAIDVGTNTALLLVARVGADGRIERGRTMQVIEATDHGVDRIPFICDTNTLTLEVAQGGKELTGEVRRIGQDVFTTEIMLAKTLDLGETLTLEYWTTYRYPGNFDDSSEREFRRAVMRHMDNLDIPAFLRRPVN